MPDAKPPKILGVPMTTDEHPEPLAEVYTVDFGCLHVAICRYADGRFNPALGAWTAGVDSFDERFVDRADAIAAIERELLAVRAAIPGACYHCGDVLVPERDRCERCPAECDGDCKEEDCAARIEAEKP